MEFIRVEQFQEQPLKVQNTFLDWWNCEPHDIYAWAKDSKCNKWCMESCSNQIQADTINKGKAVDFCIPLFTEGQIRRFIEDKAECILDITVADLISNCRVYTVIGWRIKESENGAEFEEILIEEYAIENDLFQLYWKIACRVAKEG